MNDLIVAADDAVLSITLNRPEFGNSATDEMAAGIVDALEHAPRDARVVVLRGAGRDFCIGRSAMGAAPAARPEALQRRRQTEVIFDCYNAFRKARIPIVGIVQGRALGFGCALAALCDVTVATDGATFQIPEMSHNIMPTMVMSALIDRVPRKSLAHLVYSNDLISAERALVLGVVSDVVPAAQIDMKVPKLVEGMLKAPAPATEGVKEFLRTATEMSVAGAVDFARNLHATINSSSEMKR